MNTTRVMDPNALNYPPYGDVAVNGDGFGWREGMDLRYLFLSGSLLPQFWMVRRWLCLFDRLCIFTKVILVDRVELTADGTITGTSTCARARRRLALWLQWCNFVQYESCSRWLQLMGSLFVSFQKPFFCISKEKTSFLLSRRVNIRKTREISKARWKPYQNPPLKVTKYWAIRHMKIGVEKNLVFPRIRQDKANCKSWIRSRIKWNKFLVFVEQTKTRSGTNV